MTTHAGPTARPTDRPGLPDGVAVPDELQRIPTERLEAEITTLAANLWAGQCRWLLLVGELDRRQAWKGWECRSAAHWLSWKCGVGLNAAREQVRVARAIAKLPLTRAGFASGVLSFSKVRALTRVATPETEEDLVDLARRAPAAHLERMLRAYRWVARQHELDEAGERHGRRRLDLRWDDDGSLVLNGRFSPEDGAEIAAALEALRDAAPLPDDETDVTAVTLPDARREERRRRSLADALVLMARVAGAAAPEPQIGAPHAHVVVHVDAASLVTDSGERCEVEDGPAIPPETARRLACDAAVVAVVDDGDGEPLSVGRRRAIPHRIRRALWIRDRGCRFPACAQTRFLHAHHVVHHAHGGETKLSNLVLVCRHHHRAVHEGGWNVALLPGSRAEWCRPDGTPVPATPAPAAATATVGELNRARGLEPDPGACDARWWGELDLRIAVDGLVGLLGMGHAN